MVVKKETKEEASIRKEVAAKVDVMKKRKARTVKLNKRRSIQLHPVSIQRSKRSKVRCPICNKPMLLVKITKDKMAAYLNLSIDDYTYVCVGRRMNALNEVVRVDEYGIPSIQLLMLLQENGGQRIRYEVFRAYKANLIDKLGIDLEAAVCAQDPNYATDDDVEDEADESNK